MENKQKYQILEINPNKIADNTKYLVDLCNKNNISVAGVIKGVNAEDKVVDILANNGCKYIASSRIEQLTNLKEKYIHKETILIRMPMKSEIKEVVKYIDISLN